MKPMNHRYTPKRVMNGLNALTRPYSQRGIGNSWMLLTIGIMVGFIFGFILFLSRLPDEHYTLVETERGVEQYETEDAEDYAFYDRLSDDQSAVPNAKAQDLPAFSRDHSAGKFGAEDNERPSAVKLAEGLSPGIDVAPIEVAAASGIAASGVTANGAVASAASKPNRTRVVSQPTILKKTLERPSTSFFLQAGAFTSEGDALRLRQRLNTSGMDAFIKSVAIDGKQWHRVRIGPFYDSQSLNSAQTRLGQSGISYLVIKVQS